MSRILRRPMFRGGGKVSSYGNGIASGLADGGRVNLKVGGNPFIPIGQTRSQMDAGRQAINQMYGIADDFADVGTKKPVQNTGGNILKRNINKLKNLRFGSMSAPATAVGSGLAALSVGAPIGAGIGQLADFYAKSTSTPEGYRRLKEMGGPKMTFDETNIDVGQDLDYIAQGNMMGEKPGFFPRGGKAKFYEDRGYNPDGTLKQILDDQTKGGKDSALEAAGNNPNKEFNVNDEGEPTLTKKERLEKAAKEYEDILGAGIKRDSIFDAMVEGGTRLLAGEGYAAALNAANKELDPIQNIKTASRKLALEEDIAIRKALAVSKGKRTATGELLDFYKSVKDEDGKRVFSDQEIAGKISKGDSKADKMLKYKDAYGTSLGFKEYVKDEYGPSIKFFDVDIEKVDFENIEDGVYYQPPTGKADKYKDKFITVKDGKVIAVNPRTR